MIDFSGIQGITIPEGQVTSINSGGIILWQQQLEPPSGLPAEYREVEYIENNGKQWIDTGIYIDLSKDFELQCRAGWAVSGRGMLLSGYATGANLNNLSIELYTGTVLRVYAGGDVIQLNSIKYGTVRELADITIDYTAATGVLFAQAGTQNKSGVLADAKRVLNKSTAVLGSDTAKRYPYGMFGPMKIYNPDLVRDFIPCYRKSDKKAGMYDLVTGAFFENAGTGDFLYKELS